uniref:Protein kinase domain-containing protein n=1 Tax=Leersia perrieri TaxID=77586 RepID=A0A0D9XFZ6_9ORYZ
MANSKQLPYYSTAGGGGGGGRRGGGGSGVVAPLVVLVFLFVLAPSVFLVARNGGHVHVASGSDPKDREGNQETDWQIQLPTNNLKSILSKEMIDALAANQQEAGALSVDFFRNRASPSWKTDDLVNDLSNASLDVDDKVKSENSSAEHDLSLSDKTPKDGTGEHQVDTAAKNARRKLREKRREKRAMDLVRKDDEARVKLENAAIERSKAVDSAVLGKYSIWRKENENENSDSTVRLMRDQIIMARVYSVLAKSKNKNDLYQELQTRIKESQRAVGEATTDSDLHHSAPEKIRVMGQLLSKAREDVYDCKAVTQRLRAMLQSADEQVRSLKKQSTFLSQLAAKTIPNSIHCLSMRLTIDYYLLPLENRKFPRSENLENPELYHYALFSDNVLATSVVVNSTIMNAKEPEKHVFHLVTDKLNFGAMNMWFLLNPPGKATIHVENVDEFKWLNSSYCPVLRQLESAAMKEYYFKADRPTTLSAGSSNLKYRNPKYLSMLNHLRFYLPQVYPKLDKILFLDDDIVVQKDLTGLWDVDLNGKVNGAVETCGESFHRFDKYLNFSNPHIARNFDPNACGWAYGMNIFDLKEWKRKDITGIYHRWQTMNEDRVLWKLGTLPPGLLTFYKLTHPLDKSWHVLGLGYNPSIDRSEIDNAAVVHYNGNMKPWLELAMTKYRPYWTRTQHNRSLAEMVSLLREVARCGSQDHLFTIKCSAACRPALDYKGQADRLHKCVNIDCSEEMINRCFCCVAGDSDPEPPLAATSSRRSRRTNSARSSKSKAKPSVEYPWETYTLKELLQATGNFSDSNKLGEGGFGTVYWGRTSNGVEIAVKRLKAMTAKAEMEFAVEVEILGRVRHKNLLSLRGFYAGGDERLIVYDYMPNHSLLTHLHPHRGNPSSQHHVPLDWPRRVSIAAGAAQGLAYLHHEARPHIIHRDIKASNVLLDAEFVPKVADFGFAKLIPEGVSHLTTRVKGTLGYLAPEYAMWGKVSESCDVYSFGVLLLELASARRPLEKLPGGVKREIVQWAAPLVERRKWDRLADPRLAGKFDAVQLRAMVETAMLCTQNDAESRPTMAGVVEMLRFGGGAGERRTKEIVPVAAAASSEEIITTTDGQDDVTAGSSEPLDRRNWKLTKLR